MTSPDTTAIPPRHVPHNIDAEQGLLGTILVNNETFTDLADNLRAEHFYDPLHQLIYEACRVLIQGNRVANAVTVRSYFEREKIDDSLGVPEYLARLPGAATTIINIKSYARLVIDLSTRRHLIEIGEEMVNLAFDSPVDLEPQQQIDLAEQRLFTVAENGPAEAQELTFDESVDQAIRQINLAHQRGGKLLGLSTGMVDLDEKLGGLAPTDLIILGGRPGMGKSALSVNIGYSVAYQATRSKQAGVPQEGGHVHIFSQEMSAEQLAKRIMASRSGLDSEKLRRGAISEADMRRLIEDQQRLRGLPITIDQTGGLSIGALAARARRVKRKKDTQLIIIDYLQLMDDGGRENRTQGLTHITKGLKALAKELSLPIILLSQLNRKVEERADKRPQLADLRESGSIEQDADIVLFVYREEYYLSRAEPDTSAKLEEKEAWKAKMDNARGKGEVIIGKHRHAPTGIVTLAFDGARTQFSDLARETIQGGH